MVVERSLAYYVGLPHEVVVGRVVLRMPKTQHRDLVRRAEQEGVYLNQVMLDALSRSAGA